jgi:hypothetical protein
MNVFSCFFVIPFKKISFFVNTTMAYNTMMTLYRKEKQLQSDTVLLHTSE